MEVEVSDISQHPVILYCSAEEFLVLSVTAGSATNEGITS